MKNSYLWTASRARLQFIRYTPGNNYNWFFLPGGPGLGSESLNPLTDLLQLPGSIWHLDLPGDGSNLTMNDCESFSDWSEALIEASKALDKVVLVAHSTGGMYALATTELENTLVGLVLMDSAPNASWQHMFMNYMNTHPLPEVEKLLKIYSENPSNDVLRKLTFASLPYLSARTNNLKDDFSFLKSLPYNYKACEWSSQYFDQTYTARWIPQHIPTLIFAGDQDCITPLQLFQENRDFLRENILMRKIIKAGHYPWIENPKDVIRVFEEYCQILQS
jgi:pimeloyl-ACP methyl ester carboxylesterase